jgi:hypothetical protein
VAVDPLNDNNIAVIGSLSNLSNPFRYTTDGGNTWQTNSILGVGVSGVVFDPSTEGVVYATVDSVPPVVRSDSGLGGIFQPLLGGGLLSAGTVTTPAIMPGASKTLFVGAEQGIYKSTDGGSSWTIKSKTVVSAFSFDATNPSLIYASDIFEGNALVSTDGGETWSPTKFGGLAVADPAAYGSAFWTSCWSPDGGLDCIGTLSSAGLGYVLTFSNSMTVTPYKPEQVCATSTVVGLVCATVGP